MDHMTRQEIAEKKARENVPESGLVTGCVSYDLETGNFDIYDCVSCEHPKKKKCKNYISNKEI
jgi:hypothetical protein